MHTETSHSEQERQAARKDPLGWVNRQRYPQLKAWMKRLLLQDDPSPIILPPSIAPVSYLAQLLLRATMTVKTDLRTIIPELLAEWNAYDSREVLEELLILCGDLTCTEAEPIIARIITDKLGNDPVDTSCRSRALSTLQSIGTERTQHIFLRYLHHPRHAALCYTGLYRLNPIYAALELPGMVRLYKARNAMDRLRDVLDILFDEALTPPEYITVLRPFVEQAEPESFIDVLELFVAINVFNEIFFNALSASQSHALFGQLFKRARTEDCGQIVSLIEKMGMTIEPPPGDMSTWQSNDYTETDDAAGAQPPAPVQPSPADDFYYIVRKSAGDGPPRKWPLAKSSELGKEKPWHLMRAAAPDIMLYIEAASNYPS